MENLDRQTLNTLLSSAGVPASNVTTDHTDDYTHGPASLAIAFPGEGELKKFFQAADNNLTTTRAREYFGRMRDAGSPEKMPGQHEGGTVVFPDIRITG